ncbi:hypothetical protein C7E15_10515 [Stenotrophomonas maltophilia]|nr:hypothetical protein C7E15_10515 [Stenotrophomonas maltophilia]
MCRARAIRYRSGRVAGCARARTACSARSRSCRAGRVGSAGLRPAPAVVPAAGRQPKKQQRAFRGMAEWVRLRGTLQVPLRGPAQPLAAVRSGACEAVLRKQSALTHVSSVAPSMALTPPQPDPPRLRKFFASGGNSTGSDPVATQRDLTPSEYRHW